MSKMKLVFIFMFVAVVLLHGQGMEVVASDSASEIGGAGVAENAPIGQFIGVPTGEHVTVYDVNCGGAIAAYYSMVFPNTLNSQTFNPSANTTIGTIAKRPYPIQGDYTVWISGTSGWTECWNAPYFKIEESIPAINCTGSKEGKNRFTIPANQSAKATFFSGNYVSKFLGILWVTNQWGVPGKYTVILYFDADDPFSPANVRCDKYSKGTVTLSWDTPSDRPLQPTDKYQASGIKGYKICIDNSELTPGTFITGNSKQITLNGAGQHKIEIIAYDYENNMSDPVTKYILVDQTPPTGNIVINNNSQSTKEYNVTLSVSGVTDGDNGSGISQVGFSNDKETYTWYDWESAIHSSMDINWPLSSGDGEKIVFMKLKDAAGNETPDDIPIQAKITLDTTPPSGSFKINDNASSTINQLVKLTLEAEDKLSNPVSMQLSNNGTFFYPAEEFKTCKYWPLSDGAGTKTVYVRFTDNLGNTTTEPIAKSIEFNSDQKFTELTPIRTLQTDEELIWSGNYTVIGLVIVPANKTLTIKQNAIITVDGPTGSNPFQNGLIVEGSINIESGVTISTTKPGWMGIVISGQATIIGANINLAQRGLTILNNATVTIDSCNFTSNLAAIHAYASRLNISNCIFQNNTYGIKEDDSGLPTVRGCNFISNIIDYYSDTLTKITVEQLNALPDRGNAGNQHQD